MPLSEARDVVVGTTRSPGTWLMRGLRSLYDSAAGRMKRMLAPFLPGFDEHGWSGKLFLISGGISIAGTVTALLGSLVTSLFRLDAGGVAGFVAGGLVLRYIVIPLHRRFLLGVARFETWAQVIALLMSGAGAIGGAAMLTFGQFGLRGLILAIAQTALSAQFFVYFWRHGRWTGESEADETAGIETASAASLPAGPAPSPSSDRDST